MQPEEGSTDPHIPCGWQGLPFQSSVNLMRGPELLEQMLLYQSNQISQSLGIPMFLSCPRECPFSFGKFFALQVRLMHTGAIPHSICNLCVDWEQLSSCPFLQV